VYIPGKFGMRLEDDVHVTAHDPVLLTTSPREMIEL
jgi:Xaa-Pro aminopeptidase